MRGLLAVAWLEVVDRRRLLLVALGLGLLAIPAPLLFPSDHADDVRAGYSALATLVYLPALAVILGASVMSRDLAERRRGFLFTRPIGALAMWAGKMTAAVVLIAASTVPIAAPACLLGGRLRDQWLSTGSSAELVPASIFALVAMVVLGAAAAVGSRSRSAFAAGDVAVLALVTAIVISSLRSLLVWNRGETLEIAVDGTLILVLAALLVASARGFVTGRTDIVRVHRTQSVTLWSLAPIPLLACVLFVRYVTGGMAEDLAKIAYVRPAPRGDWMSVCGPMRRRFGYEACVLYSPSRKMSLPMQLVLDSKFSGDGRTVAWVELDSRHESSLRVRRLEPPSPIEDPHIPVSSVWARIALSEDGARVAVADASGLAVYETASGRSLYAEPPPQVPDSAGRQWNDTSAIVFAFADLDHVRIRRATRLAERSVEEIREIDLVGRHATTTATLEGWSDSIISSPDMDRFLASGPAGAYARGGCFLASGPAGVWLLDGRTGARLAPLTRLDPEAWRSARFLEDGRLVVPTGDPAGSIDVYSREGVLEGTIRVAAAGNLHLGAELAPGVLSVGIASGVGDAGWAVTVVDVASGPIYHEAGLRPVVWPQVRISPGAPGSRLFYDERRALVSWDPETHERGVILPGKGGAMKLLAVLRLEVGERRLVPALALAIGLLAIPLPLVFPTSVAADVRAAFAFYAAALGLPPLALLVAASTMGRDLAERRRGFLFARPVGGISIWGGKLAAAAVLVAAAGILVVLPTLATGAHLDDAAFSGAPWRNQVSVFVLVLAACVLAGATSSIAIRSRSALVALDLAGLALAASTLFVAVRPLYDAGADPAVRFLTVVPLTLLAAALACASAWALVRGGTEPRRVHRAQSLTLWPLAAMPVVGALLLSRFILSVTPDELESADAGNAPRGTWTSVCGSTRSPWDYYPCFLYDTASGEAEHIAGYGQFADDGKSFVWLDGGRDAHSARLLVRRLVAGGKATDPHITVLETAQIVLAPDGSRVGVIDEETVAVYELPSGRSLFAGQARPKLRRFCSAPEARYEGYQVPCFIDATHLRYLNVASCPYQAEPGAVTAEMVTIDIERRHVELNGSLLGNFREPVLSPSRTRLLVRRDRRIELLDGETLQGVACLEELGPEDRGTARFLADGRIAVTTGTDCVDSACRPPAVPGCAERSCTWSLSLYSEDGALGHTMDLWHGGRWAGLHGELGANRLLLERCESDTWEQRGLVVVDLDRGILDQPMDLLPRSEYYMGWGGIVPASSFPLFHDTDNEIVSWDPATDERRVIFPIRDPALRNMARRAR